MKWFEHVLRMKTIMSYEHNWRTAWVAQSVYRLGYGLDAQGSILGRGNNGILSLCHRVQTGSGANLASYQMDAGGSYPSGKAATAWNWLLTSI